MIPFRRGNVLFSSSVCYSSFYFIDLTNWGLLCLQSQSVGFLGLLFDATCSHKVACLARVVMLSLAQERQSMRMITLIRMRILYVVVLFRALCYIRRYARSLVFSSASLVISVGGLLCILAAIARVIAVSLIG
jgi:hypothetical protein